MFEIRYEDNDVLIISPDGVFNPAKISDKKLGHWDIEFRNATYRNINTSQGLGCLRSKTQSLLINYSLPPRPLDIRFLGYNRDGQDYAVDTETFDTMTRSEYYEKHRILDFRHDPFNYFTWISRYLDDTDRDLLPTFTPILDGFMLTFRVYQNYILIGNCSGVKEITPGKKWTLVQMQCSLPQYVILRIQLVAKTVVKQAARFNPDEFE